MPGGSEAASSQAAGIADSQPVLESALRALLFCTLLVPLLAACAPTLGGVLPGVSGTGAARSQAPAQVGAVPGSHEGIASWYGPGFAGRLTANGEIFDPQQLTAAHKTLPFDTLVRVTNVENGRTVVVRINDRGPFKPGRVIDLSRAAAEQLGMVGSGTARVRVDPVTTVTGVLAVGVDESLARYDVVASGRLKGELLLLASPGAGPVLVRVVGNEIDPRTGARILLSPQLHRQLGDSVIVQTSSITGTAASGGER